MLPSLRCLRVLSLSRYQISELPQSIKNLIHLRYLDLSYTKIKQLPKSVTTLCNLQTLDLSYCKDLTELPVNMEKLTNLRHLDIRETRLTEIPTQMSRLKDLQHLTNFVVGKDGGSRISALKNLCQLRGKLHILGLENVTSGSDASKANLKGKEHLEVLELEWSGDTNDSQKEKEVLDQLQPHARVKDLSIINYGGTNFPDWLKRVHSFQNIVSLKLIMCANCYFLPSIGQLRSLKHLRIAGMKEIMEVGREFYGDASSSSCLIKPFQSLETLSFDDMLEWEEWHALGAGEFSCLLELSLVNCPKLIGELPNHLPCLRKLKISGCQQLLSIQVALLLQGLSSLQKFEVSGMPNLKELPLELCGLSNLRSLEIKECSFLEPALEMGLPPMLKTLKIDRCESLKSVTIALSSSEGMKMNTMHINNIGLEELRIFDCSSLLQLSFPIGVLPPPSLKILDIYNCSSLEFPLPLEETSIKVLRIRSSCDLLKSLSLGFFPKLRSLEIRECINFETFSSIPNGELQNLTKLIVCNCNNLKSLPHQMHTLLPSLQELRIKECPEVESFPDGGLPSNLTTLEIHNCEKLMKGRMGWGLQALPSLSKFTIAGEYKEVLESFPEEWLLPTALTFLNIRHLPNPKSLNHKGLPHLTSLKVLFIIQCPKLQLLPEGQLLNNLSGLKIKNCPLLKPRCQKEKGEDWPKISRIRLIGLDGEDIINFK
ncbi:putative disease resistance protein At3g14460 [Cornus florida]|uniref:putative disease resistance protein At3g14460 n=1 Tax=Cornus florida TaxID=4283 RepID=UPI0028A22783|nr:putative disease resistance protein At3g14460 [Cornus florida]XP_059652641.1 putative disease resistance protein At3g14460 [Cornus florida]XP_059652642.1 putative disease resistance protein At3g14460 [Cornus florida]